MRPIITTFLAAMLAALAIVGTMPAMAEVAPGQEPGTDIDLIADIATADNDGSRIAGIVAATMAVAEAKAVAFEAYRASAIACDFAREEWEEDQRSLALLIELGEMNSQIDLEAARAAIEADIATRRPMAEECEAARATHDAAVLAAQRAEWLLRGHIAAARSAEQSVLDRLTAIEAEFASVGEFLKEGDARLRALEAADAAVTEWCRANAGTTLCTARATQVRIGHHALQIIQE